MMIFGVIGQLSSELCTITFIGFLVFLVLLDYTFEHVEEAAKQRGLEHLYENLKKELMSLGLVSFAVFIYELGAKPEPNDQLFLSFEVAHMIFFFMAMAFILQALFLVSFSGTIGQQFILSLRTPVKELIVLYESARKNAKEWWWFHHGSPLLPTFPPCRASIEFRIIERLFIAQHKLSPEFNFASYVNRLFVLYIAELAHVSPSSWTIVACLVALNYLRIATVDMDGLHGCSSIGSGSIESAGIINHASDHRTLGGGSTAASTEGENAPVGGTTAGCEVYLLLYTYFCGVLLCLFAAIIYCITVLYMERIISLSLETDDIKMDANGDGPRGRYAESLKLMLRRERMLAGSKSSAIAALQSQKEKDNEGLGDSVHGGMLNDLLAGGGVGKPDQQAGLIQSGKAKNITHAKIGLGQNLKPVLMENSKENSEADDDVLIGNDNHDQKHEDTKREDAPSATVVKTLADVSSVSAAVSNHPLSRTPLPSLNRPQKVIGSEKSVCSDCDEMTGLLGGKSGAVLSSDKNNSSSGGGGSGGSGVDRSQRASLDTKILSAATTTAVLSYSIAQQPPIASVTLQQPPTMQQQPQPTRPSAMGQRLSLPAVTLTSSSEKSSSMTTTRPRPILGGGSRPDDYDDDEDSKLWFQTSLKPATFFQEEPSKTDALLNMLSMSSSQSSSSTSKATMITTTDGGGTGTTLSTTVYNVNTDGQPSNSFTVCQVNGMDQSPTAALELESSAVASMQSMPPGNFRTGFAEFYETNVIGTMPDGSSGMIPRQIATEQNIMQSALDGMRYSHTRHALPAIEDDEGHDGDEDAKGDTVLPTAAETRASNNKNNNNINRRVSPRASPRPIPTNKIVPIAGGGDEEEGGSHNLDVDVEAGGRREKSPHAKVEKDLLVLKPAAASASAAPQLREKLESTNSDDAKNPLVSYLPAEVPPEIPNIATTNSSGTPLAGTHVAINGDSDEDAMMRNIFFFRSPQAYFKAVEAILLLQCFYIAMVFTQMLPILSNGGWIVGFILPVPLILYILQRIMTKAVLLRAVYELNREVTALVIEDTREENASIDKLRAAVFKKLTEDKIPEDQWMDTVKMYFFKYDVKNEGQCREREFQRILGDIGIFLTKHSFKLLWTAVDKDLSGGLDPDEVLALFKPEDPVEDDDDDLPAVVALRGQLQRLLVNKGIPLLEWERFVQGIYNQYDVDGSGGIDPDEFFEMLSSMGIEFTPEEKVDLMLAVDSDGDGELSFDELWAIIFPENKLNLAGLIT